MVGRELHPALPLDLLYPEPSAEFLGTLAPLFFLVVFLLMIVFAHSIPWRLNFIKQHFFDIKAFGLLLRQSAPGPIWLSSQV